MNFDFIRWEKDSPFERGKRKFWDSFDQKHSLLGLAILLAANIAFTMRHIYTVEQHEIISTALLSRFVLNFLILYALWRHFLHQTEEGAGTRINFLVMLSFLICEWILMLNSPVVARDQWVTAVFSSVLCYFALPNRLRYMVAGSLGFSALSLALAAKENFFGDDKAYIVFWGTTLCAQAISFIVVLGFKKTRDIAYNTIYKQEQIIAEKKKLLSILVHDLRNPISSQAQLSRLALMFWDTKEPEEIRTMLTKMGQSSEAMLGVIENILNWSRIESEQIPVQNQEASLVQIIKEVQDLVALNLSAKSIHLQVPSTGPIIVTDAGLLKSVILNVIGNAIKYSPLHGVIKVSLEEETSAWLLKISDEGLGVSDELLEKILEGANQLSKSGSEDESGSGLGLRITKDFVQRLGGELVLDNTRPKGLLVQIKLPKEPE